MSYNRITIDHRKMGGLPCIRDLRIPVSTVIGQLAAGRTHEEILADFPDLEEPDIVAALEYAAAAVQERELPLAAGLSSSSTPTSRPDSQTCSTSRASKQPTSETTACSAPRTKGSSTSLQSRAMSWCPRTRTSARSL